MGGVWQLLTFTYFILDAATRQLKGSIVSPCVGTYSGWLPAVREGPNFASDCYPSLVTLVWDSMLFLVRT